jgi:Tol biopolymer transport system component
MRGTCKIGVYTINTESVVYLAPPKDSAVFGATFDPKSSTIAFILAKQVGPETIDYQLATSQIDGSGLRVLTSSDTQKSFPAYSFDGQKIIFEGRKRCTATSASYCWGDIYEFDFQSNKENRLSNLQALQVGPAHFLPGNKKIVTPIVGNLHPEGLTAVPVATKYGSDRDVFIVDAGNAADYEQLALDTPTASSPKPLLSGEIAFVSRVNEYENVKGTYIYDVFLWSNGVNRRLTQSNRFIRDYAITDTAKSVLLVTETKAGDSQCGLMLWNVDERTGRNLKCDRSVSELPLSPWR